MLYPLFFIWKKLAVLFIGERCRFYPSCSDYYYEALKKHGLILGSILGISRIIRCNPLCKGGIDLVPKRFTLKDPNKIQ